LPAYALNKACYSHSFRLYVTANFKCLPTTFSIKVQKAHCVMTWCASQCHGRSNRTWRRCASETTTS